jgi:hypothetical protein
MSTDSPTGRAEPHGWLRVANEGLESLQPWFVLGKRPPPYPAEYMPLYAGTPPMVEAPEPLWCTQKQAFEMMEAAVQLRETAHEHPTVQRPAGECPNKAFGRVCGGMLGHSNERADPTEPARVELLRALDDIAAIFGDCEEWSVGRDPQTVVSAVKDYMAGAYSRTPPMVEAPAQMTPLELAERIKRGEHWCLAEDHPTERAGEAVQRPAGEYRAALARIRDLPHMPGDEFAELAEAKRIARDTLTGDQS